MKIILTAINAKFIHSSLALRSIYAYCEKFKDNLVLNEFTINNDEDYILSELYLQNPDVICFSCYIWNMKIIKSIISNIKKVLPNVKIMLGGPEVSYEYDEVLKNYADVVMIGEGEKTFFELADYLINGNGNLESINGIAYFNGDKIITTNRREPLSLDEIPFAYKNGIEDLDNRIIYYEASRGCPYKCQYCLSSIEGGVRFLSFDRVKSDLGFFIQNKVKQVKFVDRTFNCNKKLAIAIWNYLKENDNGITNFHFEVSADILDDEMLSVLETARKGLFQLEIGVQSTNDNTLDKIKRRTDLDLLFNKVRKIKKWHNIHQHLDLIAGLPEENYKSFGQSFNDVFALYPEQLQLGFLKLLKGSGLRRDAEKYGIVYREEAPYEVLFTKEVSYLEMLRLKRIEEMVENYYNSGKAVNIIHLAVEKFNSPFDFFEKLSLYWESINAHKVNHNKMKLYEILYRFLSPYFDDLQMLRDIIRFDILLNDNLKNLPDWLEYKPNDLIKSKQIEFYTNEEMVKKILPKLSDFNSKQLSRMTAFEKFDFDILSWIENDYKDLSKKESYILFSYTSASFNSCAEIFKIEK